MSQKPVVPLASQARPYQGSYLIGFFLLGVSAMRAFIYYQGEPQLVAAILLLIAYGLLYATEPTLSPRFHWHRFLYFPLQTALLLVVTNLRPFLDNTCALCISLGVQALHTVSRRVAMTWMLHFAVLLSVTLILGVGRVEGAGLSLVILGGSTFLISYDLLCSRTQADQAESQVLLAELQQAHQKLQEHAALVQELAAARERNRLARELHDSVSQVIFGISLTAQSARLLLEGDPVRVCEQLDRLEEVTGSALSQLRALIAQLGRRSIPKLGFLGPTANWPSGSSYSPRRTTRDVPRPRPSGEQHPPLCPDKSHPAPDAHRVGFLYTGGMDREGVAPMVSGTRGGVDRSGRQVLIVDDNPHVRQELCTLLPLAGEIEIVGEAADGLEAVRLARHSSPRWC